MYLKIPDFIYIAEAGRAYKIFIQSDDDPEWVEVKSPYDWMQTYSYEPVSNLLPYLIIYSYGGNTTGTSSVKVVFE